MDFKNQNQKKFVTQGNEIEINEMNLNYMQGSFQENKNSKLIIRNYIIFKNNTAGQDGGALYSRGSIITIDNNSLFEYNYAELRGGAIFISNVEKNI